MTKDDFGRKTTVRVSITACVALLVSLFGASAFGRASLPSIGFRHDGYYWTRFVYFNDLANMNDQVLPGTRSILREPLVHTQYLTHHIRWEPRVTFGSLATVYLRLDGLRDVVWGDNAGLGTSPLLAETPSNTGLFGQDVPSIQLTNIYLKLKLSVSYLKIGRMPIHWGMGLLYNRGGNLLTHRAGIDDDFGDNHTPTIYDRVQLTSDVFSLYNLLKGRPKASKKKNHRLIAGYAFSRLVEEPFSSRFPMDMQRPYGDKTFLSRQSNGVDEHVGFLLYRWKHFADGVSWLKKWGPNHVTAGFYFAYRRQRREDSIVRLWESGTGTYNAYDCAHSPGNPACGTDADLYILDPYLKIKIGRLLELTGEGYVLSGSVEPGSVPGGTKTGKMRVYGWAVRAMTKALRPFNIKVEAGQASGDASTEDNVYRQRAMHPDHNAGLIMYEEFLRQRAATTMAYAHPLTANPSQSIDSPGALPTGGVMNSYYVMPTVSLEFIEALTMRLGVLSAWAHKQDGFFFPKDRGSHIGTEVDVGFDVKWGVGDDTLRHMLLRLEAGYLLFGSQVKPDYDSFGVFSLQARLAFVL